jgi:hypothetical protein
MIGMNAKLKTALVTAAVEIGIEFARIVGVKIVEMATRNQKITGPATDTQD